MKKRPMKVERKQKGGFIKGRFWRMCSRSLFWYRGTSACTLGPVCGTWEHPNVPSFRFLVPVNIRQNHPFWRPPLIANEKHWGKESEIIVKEHVEEGGKPSSQNGKTEEKGAIVGRNTGERRAK